MVCFLFLMGQLRRTVGKLVTSRKFQPCVPAGELQLSCLLFSTTAVIVIVAIWLMAIS